MAVPHAQAKQMLEETKRREEEAIKRQAQAAKHFEEKAKEIEARFAATKAAKEAIKLRELQEQNTKRVQKREAERLRRELELQAEAQAREAARAHVLRDLAWRRFSYPHSLRGGAYPREPVLAGVLRACSAKVAYMPWPLPELHGGGGHGGGGGGSAAAAAMASNPIARSELSHLRKLFPQKFEAARRCPQTLDDFEALLARRAQGEEAGPLIDQSRQAIYVTAVGNLPHGWGPVLADACRFWFGACVKSAFAPGLCPPHRWSQLEAPLESNDTSSLAARANATATKKKGARSRAAAVAAASNDPSEHPQKESSSARKDLPPPPPPLYVVDAVGDGPFVRGGAELKVTPVVANQTSSYGASAVDPLHPALAPPEDAVAAAAAAEEVATDAAAKLVKGETSLSEANQAATDAEKAKMAMVREVDLVATHEYLGRLLREASHLSDAVMLVAVTVQPFADPRAQAKAALKHANRPRLRFRDPDAKARSDAEAAAEQEAATQLGQYARRIAPMATAHWSQQSIDLAQNTVVISIRPPRKKPKRPRRPSDDDADAAALAAAEAARKAAQEALAAAVEARSISLLEAAIPPAASAGVDGDEVAAAQKLLEQLRQAAEDALNKPRPVTAEVVAVPTHLSAEGTAAAELTALLVGCRLVHFQRPLCADGHDTVAKISALTDNALRGYGFKKAQVTNLRKAIVKSNEASEKEKAAAAAAREKAEKEEERKRLAEEEEARVAKEKKEAAALAEAMQDAKDGGLGDNADGVAGEISQDNDGSGASVGAGSANAEGVGDDGSVGSGIGVQDEHLAHRLALTVNKSKAKTQTTLLVSGSRMLRHCLAAVPVAVSTALGLGPCLYGCACAMRPIPSEVPGGERPVPPPPPPPLLSKADSSSSPGKVAQEGRDTEEDDPFAPVQTHKEASGLAPDPPPLAVPAPLRCCPLCLAKVALSVDLCDAAFSPMARERLFLTLCSTSSELRDAGGRFSVTKLCAPDLKWSAAFVEAVESELFGSSPEGSLALAGHHASQPKPFDRMRHRFKSLGGSVPGHDESLNSFTGSVRFENGNDGDDDDNLSMSVGSVKGARSLDDALARLSVEASNSSAAALHRHHQQQNQRSSALSSSSLEGQHPTRRLPLTRKSVLECAHPAPPPPYAGTERFLPTRNQNPNLPQEADGKAAAAAAAHAVATAALGGTKLGAHLPPWEAGPGLLWNGDSLVSRAPHAEARHGQVWLDPSRTLNGGVMQWESSKRFNVPKHNNGDDSKEQEAANRAEEEDALAQAASFASGAAKARSEAATNKVKGNSTKGGAGGSGFSDGGDGGGSIFSYGMFPLQRTRVVPEPLRPRWLPEPGSAETPTPGRAGASGSNSVKSGVSFGDKDSLGSSPKKKGSRRGSMAPVRR